ncbi:hypothetical protein EB061_08550, partial [bacterium]|nr:hypothetical protein [bacterium]
VLLAGARLAQGLQAELGNVDFFDLKSVFEGLFEGLRTKGIRSRPADPVMLGDEGSLYHPGQTLQFAAGKDPIGFIGRIHPRLEAGLKLSQAVYWGEIEIEPLIGLTPAREASFKAWSAFPTMERDFALLVQDSVPAENIAQIALKYGKPIAKVVKIFDTYRGSGIPEGMVSIGVRVIFSDEGKSLEEKQVEQCSELIVQKWKSEFGASLR